jgi:hypothetical protein
MSVIRGIVGLKGIGFIHAMSSLQTTVSHSTAEAEHTEPRIILVKW